MIGLALFIQACSLGDNKSKKTNDSVNNPQNEKTNKEKILMAFEEWKSNEIKQGRLQTKCPELGSDEYEKLSNKYRNSTNDQFRWAYEKTLKIFYADFNQDKVEDALIVINLIDCLQGNGYVGDNQKAIIFISNGNHYTNESKIIDDLTAKINLHALRFFANTVAYTEIHNILKNSIVGVYYDWAKEDPSGQPSVKKSFSYDFLTKKLLIIKN